MLSSLITLRRDVAFLRFYYQIVTLHNRRRDLATCPDEIAYAASLQDSIGVVSLMLPSCLTTLRRCSATSLQLGLRRDVAPLRLRNMNNACPIKNSIKKSPRCVLSNEREKMHSRNSALEALIRAAKPSVINRLETLQCNVSTKPTTKTNSKLLQKILRIQPLQLPPQNIIPNIRSNAMKVLFVSDLPCEINFRPSFQYRLQNET